MPFRHPQCCTPSSCPGAGGQATFSHSERHFLWAAPRTVSTDECLLRSAGHGPRALPVPHAQASSAGGPSETPLTAALGCDHDLSVCVLGKVLAFTVQHLIQPLYGPGTHLPPTGFPQHLLSQAGGLCVRRACFCVSGSLESHLTVMLIGSVDSLTVHMLPGQTLVGHLLSALCLGFPTIE